MGRRGLVGGVGVSRVLRWGHGQEERERVNGEGAEGTGAGEAIVEVEEQ